MTQERVGVEVNSRKHGRWSKGVDYERGNRVASDEAVSSFMPGRVDLVCLRAARGCLCCTRLLWQTARFPL